jgi:uncharacterized membrane protein YfcA
VHDAAVTSLAFLLVISLAALGVWHTLRRGGPLVDLVVIAALVAVGRPLVAQVEPRSVEVLLGCLGLVVAAVLEFTEIRRSGGTGGSPG